MPTKELKPVVDIQRQSDLHHLLLQQKIINRQAMLELHRIADNLPLPEDEQAEMQIAVQAIESEAALLAKYASYPTLQNFADQPDLRTLTRWGATFGVALIVGEIILKHIKALCVDFEKAHRGLLTALMLEMDNPRGDGNLPMAMTRAITISFDQATHLISEEERHQVIYNKMSNLAYHMLLVLKQYKLVEAMEDCFVLTTVGRRVLFHLLDAQRFIDAVTLAHKRFQEKAEEVAAA